MRKQLRAMLNVDALNVSPVVKYYTIVDKVTLRDIVCTLRVDINGNIIYKCVSNSLKYTRASHNNKPVRCV